MILKKLEEKSLFNSLDDSFQEIDSNCLLVVVGKDTIAVPLDHGRLSYDSISHDYDLRDQEKGQEMKKT